MRNDLENYGLVKEFDWGESLTFLIFIGIVVFNILYLRASQIVYGKWYKIFYRDLWPPWKSFTKLTEIAIDASTEEERQRARNVEQGMYYVFLYLVIVALIGFIIT